MNSRLAGVQTLNPGICEFIYNHCVNATACGCPPTQSPRVLPTHFYVDTHYH